MQVVVALMQHETNTFSTLPTTLESFASGVGLREPPSGLQAIDIYGKADFAFSALLDVAKEKGAEITVPIAAYAEPSGKVTDAAFEFIADKICSAVADGCDALLLDLHGAMVTVSYDDGEGELLRRIRRIAPNLPIAVALDFHTNLTADIVDNCTVIDGYRTYPHIDMYDTGARAANSLFTIMANNLVTRMHWRSLPMMTHMIKQTPLQQPMKDIMNQAIAAVDTENLLNVSVFGGFPLADIPHVSLSVLAVEASAQNLAEPLIDELCEMAWQRRADFIFEAEPLVATVSRIKHMKEFPIVVADHGDNSGAGGSADDLTVLTEMLNQGLEDIIAGPIWDPEAVEQMIAAGAGADVSVSVGGKTDVPAINQQGQSLMCQGRVTKITDGRFTLTGPMQKGLLVNIGRAVILDTGPAKILVSEERWEPYDPGCFTHAGLNPTDFRYILIKSRQHFRAAFEPLAKQVVLAAGPGICSSDYSQFNFTRLKRPAYPLDIDTTTDDTICNISHSDAV